MQVREWWRGVVEDVLPITTRRSFGLLWITSCVRLHLRDLSLSWPGASKIKENHVCPNPLNDPTSTAWSNLTVPTMVVVGAAKLFQAVLAGSLGVVCGEVESWVEGRSRRSRNWEGNEKGQTSSVLCLFQFTTISPVYFFVLPVTCALFHMLAPRRGRSWILLRFKLGWKTATQFELLFSCRSSRITLICQSLRSFPNIAYASQPPPRPHRLACLRRQSTYSGMELRRIIAVHCILRRL
ncbi:hypothetical protein E4T47_05072 [Aureobasidium subglaciale]|nr:hypothetical protein E4T47_05072 [Aureobasidium subglaciale]